MLKVVERQGHSPHVPLSSLELRVVLLGLISCQGKQTLCVIVEVAIGRQHIRSSVLLMQ